MTKPLTVRCIVILGLLVVLALNTASVLAADPSTPSCTVNVFSEGGLLNSQAPAITNSVNAIQSKSARIRVFGLASTPGTLDNFVTSYASRCGLATGSTLGSNVIIAAVDVRGRTTLTRFGAGWQSALSSRWIGIQGDMNARFKAGDYAGGMAVGLQEINSALPAHPAVVAPPPVSTSSATSTDHTGAWIVAGLLVFLVLVGLLILFARYISRRQTERQEGREARASAQTCAEMAQSRATNAIRALKAALDDMQVRVAALPVAKVRPATMEDVRRRLSESSQGYDLVAASYSTTASASDPSRPGLTVGQYEVMEDAFKQVVQQIDPIQVDVCVLNAKVERLEADPVDEFVDPDPTSAPPHAASIPRSRPGRIPGIPVTSAAPRRTQPGESTQGPTRYPASEALADADSALRNAESFILTNWYFVGRKPKRMLRDAKGDYDAATRRHSVRGAQGAQQKAQLALAMARHQAASSIDYRSASWYESPWHPWYIYPAPIVPVVVYDPFLPVYFWSDGGFVERPINATVWEEATPAYSGGTTDWDESPSSLDSGGSSTWDSAPDGAPAVPDSGGSSNWDSPAPDPSPSFPGGSDDSFGGGWGDTGSSGGFDGGGSDYGSGGDSSW